MEKVSIPHRYDQNKQLRSDSWMSFLYVSIPHRYDQNVIFARRWGLHHLRFQFLIGTIKTCSC